MDKQLKGGKLYLKKGTVVDVHPGAMCDVSVDDTGDVIQVRTGLPLEGWWGDVLIKLPLGLDCPTHRMTT